MEVDRRVCTALNEFCEGDNYCVYHSDRHYQCLPSVLGDGELCGQNDGTNYWRYEACPSGQSCQAKDSDYHCLPYDGNETKWIDLYGDCTAINAFCKEDYQCIRHSDFYYQCHPSKLGHGELCGQNDGKNDWLYKACSDGQTC